MPLKKRKVINQLKFNNMNAAQAKTIQIADYLQSLGYSPAKIQGYEYWYCSPYQEKRTALHNLTNLCAYRQTVSNANMHGKATKLIKSANSTVYNRSTQFAEYKDLNDYLCGKKLLLKKQVRKAFKL
ncbi:hypothetical protein AGMMS49574_05020 [Bacteroidia bacterium]|nr:hypothetical protein AGMMS49574_05020 [Bacteroidia bacterium]